MRTIDIEPIIRNLTAMKSVQDAILIDGESGGKQWTGKRSRDYYISPAETKCRWLKERNDRRQCKKNV